MSRSSKLFESIPIDLKKRSGFDLSHENLLTQDCGSITPILYDELLPNDTVSLGMMCQVQLPPLATNFYGRVDVAIEAFFVPFRLLWGGWKPFFMGADYNPYGPDYVIPKSVPTVLIDTLTTSSGTLLDFLDYNVKYQSSTRQETPYSVLPLIAYHRVFDDWYRNKNLHKPVFVNPYSSSSYINGSVVPLDYSTSAKYLPYIIGTDKSGNTTSISYDSVLYDGVKLNSLRQRQWEKDYFTTCSLYPQASVQPSKVDFSTSSATGSFTIAQLRSANIVQRFLERNNIAGYDYYNEIYAQFGVTPSDQHLDKPYFLNQTRFSIYSQSISVVSAGSSSIDASSRNPFGQMTGSKYGQGQGLNKSSLIPSFTAKEHGYLMVFSTLVPHAYYSNGASKMLKHVNLHDFAFPLLEGLGEQPVYKSEIQGLTLSTSGDEIFGYNQQYSEYKYKLDRVHGLLKKGEGLEAFALQRNFAFSSNPSLNVSFVEIPKNFLDQVFVANTSTIGFSAWSDYFFNYKKVSSLSEYVIPTLGDMKHTYTRRVAYRGTDIRG